MVFGYGGYDDGGGSDSKNRGLHGWWTGGLFPSFACDGQLECLGQGMLMKEDISSCTKRHLDLAGTDLLDTKHVFRFF